MILIRHCHGFDELQACVDLQVEVWGYSDGDVIPRRVFLVAQKIGGQVIGAFDVPRLQTQKQAKIEQENASTLVGFSLSLPGVKTGVHSSSGHPESYLHSHMLAVREGYRDQSIGQRLKLAQRDDALARGIQRMEWTFDPLEIKNAFLNIHKLGAVVRSYQENFYGVSSSRLQGGLQTDRLVAEWWLSSARVLRAVSGAGQAERDNLPKPTMELEIVVPAAIYAWKLDDLERHRAEQVQTENRVRFKAAFDKGLAVTGFRRDGNGNGIYELAPWNPDTLSPINNVVE